MIGAFARMLGSHHRVVSVENDNAVRAQGDAGYRDHAGGADAPPEAFVEKHSDEGGDVYVAPVLESLRAALRARLGLDKEAGGDASTAAPEGATRAPRTGSP